ncbi:MAG: squalene synthase HpnC [Acidobacteriota bacterium]
MPPLTKTPQPLSALPDLIRVQEAFSHCERLTRAHYENFPVGSLLVPRAKRRYVWAIYSFARIADDYADEGYDKPITPVERLRALEDWEAQLHTCTVDEPLNPVFVAMAATIRDLDIPVSLLEDLLSAFKQDVIKKRYSDFSELVDYCRRSANPIGRLILLVFGYRARELDEHSDSICTALQLANFWQDVSVDVAKDRIYLPLDAMNRWGVTENDIRAGRFSPEYAGMLAEHIRLTRELFAKGRPLCEMVTGRLRYELRLTWLCGMRILERLEAQGFDTLSRRPVIDKTDQVGLLAKALFNRL